MKLKLLISLIIFTICSSLAQADDQGQKLLDKLSANLKGVTDLSAKFVQSTKFESVEMERVTGGNVQFKTGGKMLWSYEGDDPQKIYCDGRLVWVYQIRDKNAVRRDIKELNPSARVALDLIGGFAGAEKFFKITSCGDNCMEFTPKTPDPNLKKVKIELAGDPLLPKKVSTEDPTGNVNSVELSEIVKNKGIADDVFTFTPPPGTDLFDGEGKPL